MKKLKIYFEIYLFDLVFISLSLMGLLIALVTIIFNFPFFIFLFSLIFHIPSAIFLLYKPFAYRTSITKFELNLGERKMEKEKIGRLVFISDLHFHDFMPKDYYKKAFAKINNLKPDAVLIGGDFVHDRDTNFEQLEELNLLKAKYKLAVLGNHDYDITSCDYGNGKIMKENFQYANQVKQVIEKQGIKVLSNENYTINKNKLSINIYGIDSLWAKRNDLSHYKPLAHNIVLAHNPQIFETINLKNVDLVLSGHNHGGGQMRLNKHISAHRLMSLVKPVWRRGFGKWVSGVYTNKHGIKMLLSRGLGLTGVSTRINCPPEICVIEINK